MLSRTARPDPPLAPTGGFVYLVRWPRTDRHEVRQRFYRRRRDAERCRDSLLSEGFSAAVFRTPVTWTEVDA